jgi:hypothetical protein
VGIHAVVSEKSYGSPWVSKASGKRPGRSGRTTIPSSVYRDPSSSVIGNGNGALIRPGKCTVPGKGGVSAPKTPYGTGAIDTTTKPTMEARRRMMAIVYRFGSVTGRCYRPEPASSKAETDTRRRSHTVVDNGGHTSISAW